MHIIIDEIHRRIHLHSFGQPVAPRNGAVLKPWAAGADQWQARAFMDRHFRDPARLHFLRHALAQDGHEGPGQRSDDGVLQAAARRVASGAWRIVFEVAAASNVVRPAPAPAASPLLRGAGRGAGARTPQRLPPASRAPAAAAPPAPAPAATPEWTQFVAQRAQAKTLVSAARDGTPFCEICEAHRRAAAEAAA